MKSSEVRVITDYPTKDGKYYVIRTVEGIVESVELTEFMTWDEDCMNQFSGWQNIQYEVEHPVPNVHYFWCKEITL